MASRAKIIEKVQKLLAFGNDFRGNEKEAAAFISNAQDLISRYQIEEAELQSKSDIPLVFTHDYIETGKKSSILWKEKLIFIIADVNNCKYLIHTVPADNYYEKYTHGFKKYLIGGTASNIEIVKILFNLICNQVEYFTKQMKCKGKTESNSYRLGMTTRIGQRLRDSKEKSILEHAQEKTILSFDTKEKVNTALMLFEKEKSDAESYLMAAMGFNRIRKGPKRNSNLTKEMYAAGYEKGNEVVLTNHKSLKEG